MCKWRRRKAYNGSQVVGRSRDIILLGGRGGVVQGGEHLTRAPWPPKSKGGELLQAQLKTAPDAGASVEAAMRRRGVVRG